MIGSHKALRSEGTLACTSELNNNEQLGEVPLPRHSSNECFQVQQGKQVVQDKKQICISPASAEASAHPRLDMFGNSDPFCLYQLRISLSEALQKFS